MCSRVFRQQMKSKSDPMAAGINVGDQLNVVAACAGIGGEGIDADAVRVGKVARAG